MDNYIFTSSEEDIERIDVSNENNGTLVKELTVTDILYTSNMYIGFSIVVLLCFFGFGIQKLISLFKKG